MPLIYKFGEEAEQLFWLCLAVTHRENQQGAKLSFIAVPQEGLEHSDGGSLSVTVN